MTVDRGRYLTVRCPRCRGRLFARAGMQCCPACARAAADAYRQETPP